MQRFGLPDTRLLLAVCKRFGAARGMINSQATDVAAPPHARQQKRRVVSLRRPFTAIIRSMRHRGLEPLPTTATHDPNLAIVLPAALAP